MISSGATLFELIQFRADRSIRPFHRSVQDKSKTIRTATSARDDGDVMLGPPMADFRAIGDQGEQGGDGNDRIVAGALPVRPAQVQPHAEFVEGQAQADAIEEGA